MTGGNGRAPVPEWIAVDWGHDRLWAAAMAGNRILFEAHSPEGHDGQTAEGLEPALLRLIGGWSGGRLEVVVCGGPWGGAVPLRPVPCPPLGPTVPLSARDGRLSVRRVPGLRQASPPDVMQGPEVRIAGFLGAAPQFDGILCLPGAQTAWARISAGEVVGFQTFLTADMAEGLANRPVLRPAIGAEWDDTTFDTALAEAMARPEALAARLASIRAGAVLGAGVTHARARLWGLLIGAELAAARPWWLGQDVAVIGGAEPARLYARALSATGAAPRVADDGAMLRAGLALARGG